MVRRGTSDRAGRGPPVVASGLVGGLLGSGLAVGVTGSLLLVPHPWTIDVLSWFRPVMIVSSIVGAFAVVSSQTYSFRGHTRSDEHSIKRDVVGGVLVSAVLLSITFGVVHVSLVASWDASTYYSLVAYSALIAGVVSIATGVAALPVIRFYDDHS